MKGLKNFKEKVKENKFKILGGAVVSVVTIGATVLITKKWDYNHADKLIGPNEIMCGIKKPVDIPFDKSSFTAGKLTDLWEEDGFCNMIIENVNLGKLEEALNPIQDITGGFEGIDIIISAVEP